MLGYGQILRNIQKRERSSAEAQPLPARADVDLRLCRRLSAFIRRDLAPPTQPCDGATKREFVRLLHDVHLNYSDGYYAPEPSVLAAASHIEPEAVGERYGRRDHSGIARDRFALGDHLISLAEGGRIRT